MMNLTEEEKKLKPCVCPVCGFRPRFRKQIHKHYIQGNQNCFFCDCFPDMADTRTVIAWLWEIHVKNYRGKKL